MNKQDIFDKPVVIISGNSVTRYYTSVRATLQDGFDPYKVVLVCTHSQKTHKGKTFRFASEADIVAIKILNDLFRKEV